MSAKAVALSAWQRLITLYQPDLASWFAVVVLLLLLKGLDELVLIRRVFRRT